MKAGHRLPTDEDGKSQAAAQPGGEQGVIRVQHSSARSSGRRQVRYVGLFLAPLLRNMQRSVFVGKII